MDITPKSDANIQKNNSSATDRFKGDKAKGKDSKTSGGTGLASINSVGAHSLNASRVIPPEVQQMVSAIASRYGIPFDPSNIDLSKLNPGQVAQMQQKVSVAANNARLLPIIFKNMKKLFAAEVKLAKFYKDLTDEACKAGYKIDKATADAYLTLFGYKQKQSRLAYKTAKRAELKAKRTEAYKKYYDSSISGVQAEIVDAEFEEMGESMKLIGESLQKRIQFRGQQRKQAEDYYQQAFELGGSDSNKSN